MILGIIPARYASTRFPGKPLADIGGKSMIQRVYEQVKKSKLIADVIVATDNQQIMNHVTQFGGRVRMTKESHASGTDRCYEALTLQKAQFDYVINIQGDEPFIQPEQIDLLAGLLDGNTEIATLVKKIEDAEQLFNANVVKAVVASNGEALYFSRSTVPHIRNTAETEWLNKHTFYKHIGMYAYRTDVLKKLTALPVSPLEKAESLEQLRWLENGFRIKVAETKTETIGIDTPEDLQRAVANL
ncbi:MAG TPA: 3-deoxy-manno-octulosonate cytidylyltransferase [Cyclobacteriaceae bacterium]|nr:3-deoxy-manno-octulosonate cytidylyltransferase [Cyclobacteriaceae bacterium]HMV08792.1 3-deoxy-manno-octulosonate cytidylyltransferase [Cyclobacteriaceae bacterium]HMV91505.1 3-deoxy-manno-octulosonate cytidylyltransferase [Cyclobacteriaceae bacterium]HMW99938.1 3-deoxy-manno-octulosonate cytidylyltransferase [Cyclobacteriaceae bacterium]HMX49199.1 3-deoxy-manno-octulosonate cytidylyltransferase [Cyclobacteriaceae bacterium]